MLSKSCKQVVMKLSKIVKNSQKWPKSSNFIKEFLKSCQKVLIKLSKFVKHLSKLVIIVYCRGVKPPF
jgi:hypothetical protein